MKRLALWWSSPARPFHAYVAAAALGLLVNVLAFGLGHTFGTSRYWDLPLSDSRCYLIGYRHFLHEPWHWPLFDSHTLNVPYAKSIGFTDSIPLWAALNKLVATIIPPWGSFSERSYLGLWHALVYALQSCLGVAILRALGQKTWAATIVTALFFLGLPMWIWRYEHASLSAHFLTLWALLLYLRTPSGAAAPHQLRAWQVLQLAVATLINPYQVVMSLGLFVVSLLRSWKIRTIAMWLPAGVAVVLLGAWLAGYFAGEAAFPMPGFDMASANLLSPLVPLRSGIIGDGRWIANVVATQFQYEGSAYLGLGMLLLVALFVPQAGSLGAAIKRHPFLFALCIGTWLFSLSNHVYFGGRQVFAFEFPARIRWISEQYRAPGRFIWLPLYVLIAFVLKWGLSRFSTGLQAVVLPILVIVQLIDASGEWKFRRSMTGRPYRQLLDDDAWRRLVFQHERLFIHPSYDCILDGTPDIDVFSQEIQYIASERALPMNGVYSARPTRDCRADVRDWITMEPLPRSLYVFLKRPEKISERFTAHGATCGVFRYGRVCSMEGAAIEAAMSAGALMPVPIGRPPLAAGEKLVVGAAALKQFVEDDLLISGWSSPEENGRWTDGPAAHLTFRFEGDVPPNPTLKIEVSSYTCGDRRSQDVDVLLGGTNLGKLHFDEQANDPNVARSLAIPNPGLLKRPLVDVELRPRDVRPASSVPGCNADPRRLGVWVQRLWFE